jgi:hypothetical protein
VTGQCSARGRHPRSPYRRRPCTPSTCACGMWSRTTRGRCDAVLEEAHVAPRPGARRWAIRRLRTHPGTGEAAGARRRAGRERDAAEVDGRSGNLGDARKATAPGAPAPKPTPVLLRGVGPDRWKSPRLVSRRAGQRARCWSTSTTPPGR